MEHHAPEKSRNILQAVNQVSIWDTLILLYSSLLLSTPQLSTLPKLFSMKTCCFISERDSTLAPGYPMGIGTRTPPPPVDTIIQGF